MDILGLELLFIFSLCSGFFVLVPGSPMPAGSYVWDYLKRSLSAQEISQTISATKLFRTKFYPTFHEIPETSFQCSVQTLPGYYADVETGCQAFHRCDRAGRKMSFLCADSTVFNQLTLVCDAWFNVECERSAEFFDYANSRLYTNGSLFDTPPKDYATHKFSAFAQHSTEIKSDLQQDKVAEETTTAETMPTTTEETRDSTDSKTELLTTTKFQPLTTTPTPTTTVKPTSSNSTRKYHSTSGIDRDPKDFPTFAEKATRCDSTCKLPDCWCGGTKIPGKLPVGQTPQMVMITFDDDVNSQNYPLYMSIFNDNRVNPNGCPIRGTFFNSHEWTEYYLVQNLYSQGHEIASHSITHPMPLPDATRRDWADEIAGQRSFLNRFAHVRRSDVRGMRAPFLKPGGNAQFQMLWEKGFLYDSSLSVGDNNPPFWPYTFDHKIAHSCMITPCPTKSYPGLWEIPLVNWEDLDGHVCSMADACYSDPPDAEKVTEMLTKNFKRHYETNRAPFNMFYHASWFERDHHKQGFMKFLDTIIQLPDVWFVTAYQALQWMNKPTPVPLIKEFKPWTCPVNLNRPAQCTEPRDCPRVFRGPDDIRDIRSCEECLEVYPWLKSNKQITARVEKDVPGLTDVSFLKQLSNFRTKN